VYIKSYAEEQDDLVNCMEKDLEKQIEIPVVTQDEEFKGI